jgi:hypothetical protein
MGQRWASLADPIEPPWAIFHTALEIFDRRGGVHFSDRAG